MTGGSPSTLLPTVNFYFSETENVFSAKLDSNVDNVFEYGLHFEAHDLSVTLNFVDASQDVVGFIFQYDVEVGETIHVAETIENND